ncbi:hypothetical protein K450DRAFT_244903 [Umbelopsis ramanniana AG]|uniref:Small acidic protein n=1 Tax=Umbelopsis ramanniana AG TaxID=1314678 RepID=A0AAD5E8M0_UMBRA|nr:uncharacterized protein K450DRAFT_244903 [Umbelopsis ramanniana AG]KAI8578872.1 hypothetical protein K450DRAFT_244903 [Umbelopsis ramanniana AG]
MTSFRFKSPSAAEVAEESGRWNDWSKASFGGDDAQKNKFLRLLGAKKAGNDAAPTPHAGLGDSSQSSHSAIDAGFKQRMNQDLEKQFQDGLKMRKQQFGGKRGGLGWS